MVLPTLGSCSVRRVGMIGSSVCEPKGACATAWIQDLLSALESVLPKTEREYGPSRGLPFGPGAVVKARMACEHPRTGDSGLLSQDAR
jgi:hypothetical protein